jgi:hypothetical protein
MAQPVAADISWACLGANGPPPTVVVVPQSQLTCRDSPGTQMQGFGCGRIGFTMAPSAPCVCVAGDENGSPIRIARTEPPLQPWHATALTHELLHRRMLDLYGDDDRTHARVEWSTLRPACDRKLEDNGF